MAKEKAKKLTDKHEMFCREYLIDLNATQAAIRAGYSEKTAGTISVENMQKPLITEYISKLKSERSEVTKIDAEWVLNASVDLYNKCMEAEPLKDQEGNDSGYAKFQPAGAGKALELIGKHVDVQAYVEKTSNETTLKVDAPLAERLTGASKR